MEVIGDIRGSCRGGVMGWRLSWRGGKRERRMGIRIKLSVGFFMGSLVIKDGERGVVCF